MSKVRIEVSCRNTKEYIYEGSYILKYVEGGITVCNSDYTECDYFPNSAIYYAASRTYGEEE